MAGGLEELRLLNEEAPANVGLGVKAGLTDDDGDLLREVGHSLGRSA